MVKNSVPTFNATIYCGLKSGYESTQEWIMKAKRATAKHWLQEYCNDVGLGLTLKDVEFIYTGGSETGIEVGLINYARFPSNPREIKQHAITIAEHLMKALSQHRVSVVTPLETILLENETVVNDEKDNINTSDSTK